MTSGPHPELAALMPRMIPKAIVWATKRAGEMGQFGQTLSEQGLRIARHVGVARPDLIRVQMVDELPLPEDPELRQVVEQAGLIGPQFSGITFGHGICIKNGHLTRSLLSHECRHVFQYEQAGSIAAFIPIYAAQIVQFGYHNAPFEIDARQHEIPD